MLGALAPLIVITISTIGSLGHGTTRPQKFWYGVGVDDNVRQAGDLFLLASLITYMVTQVSRRALSTREAFTDSPAAWPRGKWTGHYEKVLPYLRHALAWRSLKYINISRTHQKLATTTGTSSLRS